MLSNGINRTMLYRLPKTGGRFTQAYDLISKNKHIPRTIIPITGKATPP